MRAFQDRFCAVRWASLEEYSTTQLAIERAGPKKQSYLVMTESGKQSLRSEKS
jgi:hypothetical protein